jgi:hypothetical protein
MLETVKDLAFFKKINDFQSEDERKEFNNYMASRWLSMIDPQYAIIINQYLNPIMNSIDKDTYFKFLYSIIPKLKYRRFIYIKQPKIIEKYDKEIFEYLQQMTDLSKSELEIFLENNIVDFDNLKKIKNQ